MTFINIRYENKKIINEYNSNNHEKNENAAYVGGDAVW